MSEPQPAEPDSDCAHSWRFVGDWEGDPTLYNGTHDCSYAECTDCGEMRNLDDPEVARELRRRNEEANQGD